MGSFNELIRNSILIAPITAWLLAQIIKTILHAIINKGFVAERMIGGGGMPSSHSATVCALATSAGMVYGVASFEFAMTAIFAIVTMYDAMGVRRETGIQGEVINDMLEIFKDMGKKIGPEKALKELIGHTPLQVLMGGILGIVVAVVMNNMAFFK